MICMCFSAECLCGTLNLSQNSIVKGEVVDQLSRVTVFQDSLPNGLAFLIGPHVAVTELFLSI